MPPSYLFELHYRDGRVVTERSGEYSGAAPLDDGMRVHFKDAWWIVREVSKQPGFDAKIVMDEE